MLERRECTYHHGTVGNLPDLSEQTLMFLRTGNQELCSITDDAALHCHQFVGHGQHLDDKRCQPWGGEKLGQNVTRSVIYTRHKCILSEKRSCQWWWWWLIDTCSRLRGSPRATLLIRTSSKRTIMQTIRQLFLVTYINRQVTFTNILLSFQCF